MYRKPYLAGSRARDPKVSPDGSQIIFQWDSSAHNNYRTWIMHADGSSMHMIADSLVGEVAWAPDSRTIACTRAGDVFLTDTSFRSFARLTKTDAGEYGLHWSADGNFLGFNSDKTVLVMPVHGNGIYEILKVTEKGVDPVFVDFTPDARKVIVTETNHNGQPEFIVPRFTGKEVTVRSFKSGVPATKVGIAPVDTGNVRWVQLPGDEHYFLGDLALSPDGASLLIERYSADRKTRELFIADTDSGKARRIYGEKDDAWVEGGLYTTRWMPDGRHILTTSEKEGWNQLYLLSPDGSKVEKLTDGAWEIRWFDIAPAGDKIYYLANATEHAQWQLMSYDIASKTITKLSRREGTYESPLMAKKGDFIVAGYSNFGRPTELARVPTSPPSQLAAAGATASEGERQLTSTIPAAFKSIPWVVPEIISFKARDGVSVPAMIYKPAGFSPAKKYPLVVFVHGAGYLQNVYRGWSYYWHEYMFHHRLTQRGYVVFEVEYRGSAGMGRKYRTDVYMYLGGKDLDDEVDGLEYIKHLGYIDSSRVGIYGGSYGGFMTLMGLFRTDEYACGAALRAVTSWENYYRHNSWYTEARLGKPEEHAEAYRISSPITYADSLKKPLLILHGMVDDNVFFQDAVQLIGKLQRSGKKFEAMVYPDESHSFNGPESWLDEYSRIEEFFDRHLLSAPQ
jgi:dipeptidyl aminopeptidase/acylaminoacyl peptidase